MSIDMSQFHEVFFEESKEGLDIMETGLLNLDLGEPDKEEINSIFRAVHSIKGGSGTFGFMEISSFTHVMETLMDEMRDGKRDVSQASKDLLLKSVDCLREMLDSAQNDSAYDEDHIADLQSQLETMLNNGEATDKLTDTSSESSEQAVCTGWHIQFKPFEYLMRTGNDPAKMFHELSLLGDLTTLLDHTGLPPFAEMDPEESYCSWSMDLTGEVEESKIREIFEWVDEDCELTITPLSTGAAEQNPQLEPEQKAVATAPRAVVDDGERRRDDRRKSDRRATGESSSIRVSIDKIDDLINLVGELVITQSMLSQVGENLEMNSVERLREGLSQLERNTRELQENVMQIRMLPISFSFNRFPRLVHDLSNKLDKKIELKLSGEQTELDKTVMEKIGDPLVHLVRNSIDHGIEMPADRLAAGKPEHGVIELNAFHEGGNIVIEIIDDGAGIRKEKLLAKAQANGLVAEGEHLTDAQIYDLVFHPGLSTAEQVSDISGRGVGMDVVRRNIKDLGGAIEVDSRPGKGTRFVIRLPLTLAILDGQLISVGAETYIVPLVSIVESLQLNGDSMRSVAGKAEVYKLREEYIPVIRVHELFGIPPIRDMSHDGLLTIVEGDGQKVGLLVDDLLGQQQVVIKSLETNYRKVTGVSGATILGDGTVALILDIPALIELSKSGGSRRTSRQGASEAA